MKLPFDDPQMVYAFTGYNFAVCLLLVGVGGLLVSHSLGDYSLSKFICWLLVAGSWLFAFLSCSYRLQDVHLFQWNWVTGMMSMGYAPSVRAWFDFAIAVFLIPTFFVGAIFFGDRMSDMAAGMAHENSD